MMDVIDIAGMRRRLMDERVGLQGAQTRHAVAVEREAALSLQVSYAKGRVQLKDEINQVFAAAQEKAHRDTVGTYSKMLSLLVHEVINTPIEDEVDVDGLPVPVVPSKDVSLEVRTLRGAPALEIMAVSKSHAANKTTVFKGMGGAFTDVVCTGLRIIAVARSGSRKLLVLDEPDKWISPMRAPLFYGVLDKLCRDLKFQVIVVSHFGRMSFGPAWITEIKKVSEDTCRIASTAPEDAWADPAARGLRGIRLTNFRTHPNAEIRFGPGLNVVCGDNDAGKSGITQAFRAALYGDDGDDDIRYQSLSNAVSHCVEIQAEDGMTLEYRRSKESNPKASWRMRDASGETCKLDGIECAEGKDLPRWVETLIGVGNSGGLDMHIGHQKQPVFLLDKPASERATVLSIGRETEWLHKLMAAHKESLAKDVSTIREGESEINGLQRQLRNAPDFASLKADLETAASMLGEIETSHAQVLALEETATRISGLQVRKAETRKVLDVLSELPEPVPDLASLPDSREPAEAAQRIQGLQQRRSHIQALLQATADLPATIPEMPSAAFLDGPAQAAMAIVGKRQRQDQIRDALKVLSQLPDVPELPDVQAPRDMAQLILAKKADAEKLSSVLTLLKDLPEPPTLPSEAELLAPAQQAKVIRSSQAALQRVKAEIEQTQSKAAVVEAEIEELREATGGCCPLCEGPLDKLTTSLHEQFQHAARSCEAVSPSEEGAGSDTFMRRYAHVDTSQATLPIVEDEAAPPPAVAAVQNSGVGTFKRFKAYRPRAG